MAPRSWACTVDFPAGNAASDTAKWVLEFLWNTYQNFKVVSIQLCPGPVAWITFDKHCDAAKGTLEELGEVSIHGVQCFVLKPEPLPPCVQNVLVYQYLNFLKSPSFRLFSTRQTKDFSYLIAANFSDPETGCCALTNQRSARYPLGTELSNYGQ